MPSVDFCNGNGMSFLHEEMSPSLPEREQMDCRDVPASCTRGCCVKKASRGEEECPLLAPDKSISVLSEMAVKWECCDFSLQEWSSHVSLFSSLHIGIFFLCAYLSKVFTWSVGLKVTSIFFFSPSLLFFFFFSLVPLFLKMSS